MVIATATTDVRPRCWRCDRELARSLTRPWDIQCPRCKAINKSPVAEAEVSA